jgi:hypothetical protein
MGRLSEEVLAEGSRRIECQTCAWLSSSPDREEWESILRDRAYQHSAIARVMNRNGANLGESHVRRHRESHVWGKR